MSNSFSGFIQFLKDAWNIKKKFSPPKYNTCILVNLYTNLNPLKWFLFKKVIGSRKQWFWLKKWQMVEYWSGSRGVPYLTLFFSLIFTHSRVISSQTAPNHRSCFFLPGPNIHFLSCIFVPLWQGGILPLYRGRRGLVSTIIVLGPCITTLWLFK